jgi:hypothetical protein
VLRISYAPVVRADKPRTRLQVSLEINRPDCFYGLSPEFESIVNFDQHTERW